MTTAEVKITVDMEGVMEVQNELDELIALLEAQIPGNPESPENKRKAKSLEWGMQDYFKSLEQAFPYSKVKAIYDKYVKE